MKKTAFSSQNGCLHFFRDHSLHKLSIIPILYILMKAQLFILLVFITFTTQKCAYTQSENIIPYPYDGEAYPINYTMKACMDYVGSNVCCNEHNARATYENFKQIDGGFGGLAGGCDICAINLKRFWCEYACSPRQADFVKVSKEYYEYPDPQKPGKTIWAQESNLTVQASTACAIFNSCKRVPFVASVSAMGSPAGFLNFQGHNAIDNAKQMINVFFTYDPALGLYFNNATGEAKTAQPTSCEYKASSLHGFSISMPCSCNTCESACNDSTGFKYSEPDLFQGFNSILVGSFYGGVTLVAGLISLYRWWSRQRKN